MDPVSCVMMASGAVKALKGAIGAGKDLQEMTGQLANWGKAFSDFTNLEEREKNPPWWKQTFKGSDEETALEIFANKKKMEQMRAEIKDHISKAIDELYFASHKLNEINNSTYSLNEVIAPSEFKSYDELKEKLDRVLGLTGSVSNSTAESVAEDMDEVPWSNVNKETVADEPVISSAEMSSSSSEENDAMDYFKKLAND